MSGLGSLERQGAEEPAQGFSGEKRRRFFLSLSPWAPFAVLNGSLFVILSGAKDPFHYHYR
jgi:hypothetical protein